MSTSTVSPRGRYLRPTGAQRFSNRFAAGLAKLGTSMGNLHVLTVTRRHSGEAQSVPVSPIDIDGVRYLVAPRGATDWVLNARVAGEVELRSGRSSQRYALTEVSGAAAKVPVLRNYLAEYTSTVKAFFDPITVDSSDDEFAAAADGFPVFRLALLP